MEWFLMKNIFKFNLKIVFFTALNFVSQFSWNIQSWKFLLLTEYVNVLVVDTNSWPPL